jgi:cysteine-rich repeat protein
MRTWIAALVVPSLLLLGCGEDDPKEPVCGNGTVESGEACDDGNAVDGDGCSADCKSTEQCGNGFVDKGEVCDDGNNYDEDGCRRDCLGTEQCGDGLVDSREECDDGEDNGDSGSCRANCVKAYCGDGIVDQDEHCDDANQSDDDDCSSTCRSLAVGSSCERAFDLSAMGGQTSGTWKWSGDTRNLGWAYSADCGVFDGASGTQREGIARFVAPEAGDYRFEVEASFDDVLYAWNQACGRSAEVLNCAHAGTSRTNQFTLGLAQSQVVYLVVDGYIGYVLGGGWPAEEGSFTLTARKL